MGVWKSSVSVEIKGHKYTYREVEQEQKYWNNILSNIEKDKIYFSGSLISEDLNNKLCFVRRCMSRMEGYHQQTINETMAKRLNDTACSYGFDLKLRDGMKMTKILEKIAKVSGINQYKDKLGEEWVWMKEPKRNVKVHFKNKANENIYGVLENCKIMDIIDDNMFILFIEKITLNRLSITQYRLYN